MPIIEAHFENEKELENWVQENINDFFPNAIYIPGCAITSISGKGGVPDGFVFNLEEYEWYVIEAELLAHGVWNHIAEQIIRFVVATQNLRVAKTSPTCNCKDIADTLQKVTANQLSFLSEITAWIAMKGRKAMSSEIQRRQRAIRMRLAGKSVTEICERLPRGRDWFYTWWSRYQEQGANGLRDQSCAPKTNSQAMAGEVQQAILNIRDRLVRRRGAQARYRLAGAPTIRHELEVLGYTPLPSLRTIGYVLQCAGRTCPPFRLEPTATTLGIRDHERVSAITFINWIWSDRVI